MMLVFPAPGTETTWNTRRRRVLGSESGTRQPARRSPREDAGRVPFIYENMCIYIYIYAYIYIYI